MNGWARTILGGGSRFHYQVGFWKNNQSNGYSQAVNGDDGTIRYEGLDYNGSFKDDSKMKFSPKIKDYFTQRASMNDH